MDKRKLQKEERMILLFSAARLVAEITMFLGLLLIIILFLRKALG